MELPIRKRIRLRGYDYSQNGAYFITICTQNRQQILGEIIENSAPDILNDGRMIYDIQLSDYGKIAKNQIETMNQLYEHITVDNYVIMPNHIHMIIIIHDIDNGIYGTPCHGTSRTPSPTNSLVSLFVSTFKRYVNKQIGDSLFQRSFHDHIIRNHDEYSNISKYIDENPQKWNNDCFYTP